MVRRAGERLKTVLRAAALVGGIDPGVVAAQARQLRKEIIEEADHLTPFSILWDEGHKLQLRDWSRVPDPVQTAEALADAMFCSSAWIGELALGCLESAPAPARERALAILEAGLDHVRARTQWRVAVGRLALARNGELLQHCELDSRPMVRRAAAAFLSWGSSTSEAPSALCRLLQDPDRGVREEAIRSIEALGLGSELAGEVQRSAEPPVGWQCWWCAHDNTSDVTSCGKCNRNGPDHPGRSRAPSRHRTRQPLERGTSSNRSWSPTMVHTNSSPSGRELLGR